MAVFEKFKYGDVEGIRVGRFNLADNTNSIVYFFEEIMIDSGPPYQYRFICDKIIENKTRKIFLTHHHEDHSGNCSKIIKKLNIPVYMHKSGLEYCKNGFPIRMYQKAVWGNTRPFKALPLPDKIILNSGLELIAIHTPGHSLDHVCFFIPEKKSLFTGDLFLGVKPRLLRADENLKDQIKSIKNVLTYDFNTIYCSHKGMIENGRSLLEKKLEYLNNLIEVVKSYSLKGYNADQINKILFKKRETAEIISFNHLSGMNLILQCFEIAGEK